MKRKPLFDRVHVSRLHLAQCLLLTIALWGAGLSTGSLVVGQEKAATEKVLPKALIDGNGPGWRVLGEQDFTNVNCAADTWKFKDGEIHCTGLPVGVMRTKEQFKNLELVVEWRHLKAAGNSGVFLWAQADNLNSLKPAKMKPFAPVAPDGARSFPRKNLSKPSPEWNHYYVRAINGEVRLWVNGEEVSGGMGCDPATGFLCLESEGSPVEFRNLRVRVLP